MSDTTSSLYYEARDYDFLSRNLGFADPNRDGNLTSREIRGDDNAAFRDFRDHYLSASEKAILAASSARPLSAKSFAYDAALAGIALKQIRYREEQAIYEASDLPRDLDGSFFDFDVAAQAPALFDALTIDVPDLRAGLSAAEWKTLTRGDLGAFPTNTLKLLRHFLLLHPDGAAFAIGFGEWRSAYAALVGCEATGNVDSAESTWNEMLLLWQKSDPECHPLWGAAGWGYALAAGGLIRLGRPDLTLRAKALKPYLNGRGELVPLRPAPTSSLPPSPLRRANVLWRAEWPKNKPGKITLAEEQGVAIRLDVDPGASITACQAVSGGMLAIHAGEPLLRLDGFHLNIDAVSTFLRTADAAADKLLGLVGMNFDVETLSGVAVTVFRNRLCLVIRGEDNGSDLVKPVGGDFLFLDIGPFVKMFLKGRNGGGAVTDEIFDAAGNVYDDVPVADLQDAVLKALQGGGKNPGAANPFKNWTHDVQIDGVEADFTSLIRAEKKALATPDSPSVTALRFSEGRVRACGVFPGSFTAEARFNVTLGTDLGAARLGENGLLEAQAEAFYDAARGAGWLKLKFPGFKLNGAGPADGAYAGEILVGLDFSPEEILGMDKKLSLDNFLSKLAARALVDFNRDRADFLVAAVKLRELEGDALSLKVGKLVAEYDLALSLRGRRLAAVVSDGRVSVLKEDGGNPYLAFALEAAADEAVAGGFAALFGDDVALAVSRDETGVYRVAPAAAGLWGASGGGSSRAAGLSGEIEITPPGVAGNDGKTFLLRVKGLSLTLEDAAIETGASVVRGAIRAELRGEWRVSGTDWIDVLRFNDVWEGSGHLKLKGASGKLSVTDAATGVSAVASAQELASVFEIGSLRFAPPRLSGKASVRLKNAEIDVETPLVKVSGDVSGSVKIKGDYPQVLFESPESSAMPMIPELAPSLPSDLTIAPGFDESAFLDGLLKPVVNAMLTEPPTEFGAAYFLDPDFPLEAFAASIVDADLSVGRLPLATEAEYDRRKKNRGSETLSLPLFSGALAFLNPKLSRGTALYTAQNQVLADDGKLRDFRITLAPPIRFLGFNIDGVGVGTRRCALTGSEQKRLYLFTPKGRIDLMALLRLKYPCKLSQAYRGLRKQGIKVRTGELPENLADLAALLRQFLEVFSIRETIEKKNEHQTEPFVAADFSTLRRRDYAVVRKSLADLELPLPPPSSPRPSALSGYLNGVAGDPTLAEHLETKLSLFAPEDSGWAQDYIDEIRLLHFLKEGEPFSPEEEKRVIEANYRLLRLYLKPYVTQPEFLDFLHSEDIELETELKPVKADYGIIAFNEDAEETVSARLRYNPTGTEEERRNPGLYFSAATRPDDAIENITFRYKTPSIRFKSDFARIENFEYYLGPSVREHEENFAVRLGAYDASNLEFTYMPPSPFNRPAFTLFYPDTGLAQNNRVTGPSFVLEQNNDDVSARLGIDRAVAANSSIYFYLGDTGQERDIFIDVAQARFSGVEADILYDYDATGAYETRLNKISGYMSVANLPHDKPRALIYLGTTADGVRRYLIVNRLEMRGGFDIENDALTAEAHLGFLATLPDSVSETPFSRELREKGVDFNIQAVELDGTMRLLLDETRGGFVKSEKPLNDVVRADDLGLLRATSPTTPKLHAAGHLEGVTLKLYGSFRFQSGGSWITLTDLSVPLDAFMMKMIAEKNGLGPETVQAALDHFIIPAGHEIRGQADGVLDTGGVYGSGNAHLNDAEFALSSASPFEFHMTDGDAPEFETLGAALEVRDSENVLDFSSGMIRYADGHGTVKDWRLEADTRDQIYRLLVETVLSGDTLNFELK